MLRFLKTCLVMMVFRAVLALVLPPLVLAHEAPRATPSLDTAPAGAEGAFLRENEAAMSKMMSGMAAQPTGDIDADFVAMMVPHHQGAIDMAVIELRYGNNEQLRRIAQEIIVEQIQEIAAMKLAIGEPVTTSQPVPTQSQSDQAATVVGDRHHHMNMPPESTK
jgi:hypothetical protein